MALVKARWWFSADVLQKLKIVPKDAVHIDLTESPPPSPKVKRETKDSIINRGDASDSRSRQDAKREPAVGDGPPGEAGTPQSNGTPADNSDNTRTSRAEHNKKRKAVEDELKEVELEHQKVTLEQKKLRLTKALAEMDGDGKWSFSC
jgi:hypothetical protein